jgi:hypothetical protein
VIQRPASSPTLVAKEIPSSSDARLSFHPHDITLATGPDLTNLTPVPTSGTSSLNGHIGNSAHTPAAASVTVQAVPTNFAGRTTTIPETTAAALGLLALGMMVLLRKRN